MLPPFTAEGLLPPGDYPLTFDGLRQSRLITGEGSTSDNWDRSWRGKLVDNLQVLVEQHIYRV